MNLLDPTTYERFKHLKAEAAKDNIKVSLRVVENKPVIVVAKYPYRTLESALAHVKFLQAQIAPSTEERI